MPTDGGHPIRKRQRHSSQHPSRQLCRIAPKGRTYSETQLQHRLLNNVPYKQPTEGSDTVNNVALQPSGTSQSCVPLIPTSSGRDFTTSSLFWPDHTFSSLERIQASAKATAPCPNIYSNRMPLTWADGGFPELVSAAPELAPRNLFSGVTSATLESHGPSTHHLPQSNLQLQGTIQNQQRQGYCAPTLRPPEDAVWTAMAQPTIGVHQDQSSQYTLDQLAHQAPLPQNSHHVSCANCPSIWCFHLESITLSDPEGKGISNLRRSYRDLRQHIHEVHQGHYGAACALCENLFCFHLGNMMLLEAAKGDFADVKVDLGSSFITLRQHIQEAHGGC